MRVALCIYGEPRTVEFCFPSIKKNIIDIYHPDIFLCSDSEGETLRKLYKPTRMKIFPKEEIDKEIKPRVTKYPSSLHYPAPWQLFMVIPKHDLSSMFKSYRCAKLLKEYEDEYGKYDLVIGTRFDVKILSLPKLEVPEESTLYIPRKDAIEEIADNAGYQWGGYSTHIWWGTSKLAHELLDSYFWTDDYFDENRNWINGEKMVRWFVERNHVQVKYVDAELMLIRGSNTNPYSGRVPQMPLSEYNHPEYLDPPMPRTTKKAPMKLAVCVCGQARTFEFCAPSLKKHVLDVYHPDVFVSMESQEQKAKELYKPYDIEIHPEDEVYKFNENRKYSCGDWVHYPNWPQYYIYLPQAMSFLYKMWRCLEMIKKAEQQNGPYDVIFVTRPDIKFLYLDPITIPPINHLYLPRVDAHQWPVNPVTGLWWNVGYSSHTWWSSGFLGRALLDSYHWCDDAFNHVGVWCGEMLLKWFCDENGITIQHPEVTQMIIKGDKDHPRSDSFEFGKELSKTHYPEYCEPPLPIFFKKPVPLPRPGGPVIGGHPPLPTVDKAALEAERIRKWEEKRRLRGR